ncbi:nuclear body protein, partial [Clarias magur]
KVMNMKTKKETQKGLYDILDWVETNQGNCIKQFWSCVFEDHIMQRYPVFHTLQKILLNEKKNRNSEVASGEKKQGQKKNATKRKKSDEETGEEKSGASSVTSKKKKTKKPKTSPLSKGGTLPVTGRDKKGLTKKLLEGKKQVRFIEPGNSSLTSKKKPARKPKISPLLRKKTLLVIGGDEERTLFPDKPVKESISQHFIGIKRDRSPEPGTSSVTSEKKPDKNPKISPLLKGKRHLFTSGDEKGTLYPDKPVKAALLKSETLAVSCGEKTGTLYPDKLAKGEECILSEDAWFTPNDFERFSGRGSSKNWKQTIRCQNTSLLKLFKEGYLPWPHNRFSAQKREKNEDDVCCICNLKNDLVYCWECLQAFHRHCHLPIRQDNTTEIIWICTFCVLNANQETLFHRSKKDALSSLVSNYILECQYLLLRLYNADTEHVFAYNPTETVPGYSSVISNPMWLGKVRTKMQKDKYKTVKQFVHDIHLIFKNCQTFYKLPDAKKLTGSEEEVEGRKKSRNKRKKGINETEPRSSHSLKRAKKEDNSKLDGCIKKHSFTCEDKEGTLHQDKHARGSCSRPIRKVKEGKPLTQKKGQIKSEKTPDVTEDKRAIFFRALSSSGANRPSMQNTAQPIKREKKEDIWALDKTLPVTCGDKEGRLYPDKLARGEECILSQDRWFTPHAFETFSGRGNCKKWKESIYSQNTPLWKLLKEGHLQCPRTYRRYGQKKKAVSRVENSSSVSDVKTNKHRKDLKKWIKEENNEQEEDGENDGEPVDLSKFDAPAFPVSCGSVSGILYKSRFVGSRSKSIRTEERWFSPEEFVKQGLTLTDGHWRKGILCHGKTLNYLVKKRILYMHSLLCSCDLCSPNNQSELDNDDVCYICNTEGKLVCCDGCPRAFHPDCHLSGLQEDTTVGTWLCTFCVLKANNELWTQMSLKAALQCPVSENILRCEYLLLNLYKEDTQQVFTDDPTAQVAKYSRVISHPMWLNRVKSKLQNKEYETMRQFMHDVLLIFKNCKTFNKCITFTHF